jgi:hypothetical protein
MRMAQPRPRNHLGVAGGRFAGLPLGKDRMWSCGFPAPGFSLPPWSRWR